MKHKHSIHTQCGAICLDIEFAGPQQCSLGLYCIKMPHTSPTAYFLSHQCHIKINSAYGSMKDISVYNMLGLGPSQIYIVGRPSKKYQNQCQVAQFLFVFLIPFFVFQVSPDNSF